jgi:hypothetical protein
MKLNDVEDDAEQPRPPGTYTEWLKGETTTEEPLLDEDWPCG